MRRVTAPVAPDLHQLVMAHRHELGLPPDASEARVFARVIEVGARTLLREWREAERARLYEEWADDPERREAVRMQMEMALEDGLF